MMIIIVSGMMIVVLKYASISARHVSDSYVREQAELYLNSVIERALLAISAHDRSSGCLDAIPIADRVVRAVTYSANVNIENYYLLAGSDDAGFCGVLSVPITTEESHGYVFMDIEVIATVDSEQRVRIIRRTLQRP